MIKTIQYSNAVRQMISRAKKYNPEIGNYIEHYINESFSFTARLSNGRIEIPHEWAHEEETLLLPVSEQKIKKLAGSFQSNTVKKKKENVYLGYITQSRKNTKDAFIYWKRLVKQLARMKHDIV